MSLLRLVSFVIDVSQETALQRLAHCDYRFP